jgi:predicted TIM-barrel fold metal-dependent hydrolase
MQIVDGQIHLWSSGLPSNKAHWQVASFDSGQAIAMMDGAGIDAAVIHPPSWDTKATGLAIEAVKKYPGRFAIMGTVDLSQQANSLALMEQWRMEVGMLGLRCMFLKGADRQRLHDGELDWFWSAAEQFDIPVTMLATGSFDVLADVAIRYPGLRLSIDHLGGKGGFTQLKDAAAMTHVPDLLKLAKIPNIAIKATGAPGYSGDPYPFHGMHSYIHQIFDAFGPDRLFWGTDITKMPCSWQQCVTMYTEELPWLSGDDLAKVMGKSVQKWWGWSALGGS